MTTYSVVLGLVDGSEDVAGSDLPLSEAIVAARSWRDHSLKGMETFQYVYVYEEIDVPGAGYKTYNAAIDPTWLWHNE